MTKAPEDKLMKMSVPLSIFITSPRQGNHICNAGIGVKFPYLWLLMQRKKKHLPKASQAKEHHIWVRKQGHAGTSKSKSKKRAK